MRYEPKSAAVLAVFGFLILFKAVFNSSLQPISFSCLFQKLPVIPYQYFVTRYQTFSMAHVFPQQCPCKQLPLIIRLIRDMYLIWSISLCNPLLIPLVGVY
jgi:hypothetical protein